LKVGRAQPALPEADADGRIPYLATTALENMAPGTYQALATVRQGSTIAQEMLVFAVE
jgi:hypothetical protein